MSKHRHPKLSIRGPVTLFTIVLVLIIVLTVLWHVALVHDYHKLRALADEGSFHWTFIALGSVLFLTIIILSSLLGAQLIGQIRWSQRQSNFISSVSHELNSPLSSIKLFAQTLRKPDIELANRLDFVSKILFDVDRLQRLIANILRAAEMDYRGDHLQVVVQQVELRDYLQRFLDDATTLYAENDLSLGLESDTPDEIDVRIDPMMFRQVLDNLVDNAVRYRGEQSPQVEFQLLTSDESVELRVKDQGLGISDQDLPKLFDRFYRIDERPRRRGTGIGLYVVRSIIEAHGGEVGAMSDGPGKGTTLWLRLPRIEASVGADQAIEDLSSR